MTTPCFPPASERVPRPAEAAMRGFSILSALFLLVVLSALGAVMVTVSTTQHSASALDVEGARAYQAARAGLEWGLHAITKQKSAPGQQEAGSASCFSSSSFSPQAPGLAHFTVTVGCEAYMRHGVTVLRILATACNQPDGQGNCPGEGGSTYYVERQLQATLEG